MELTQRIVRHTARPQVTHVEYMLYVYDALLATIYTNEAPWWHVRDERTNQVFEVFTKRAAAELAASLLKEVLQK